MPEIGFAPYIAWILWVWVRMGWNKSTFNACITILTWYCLYPPKGGRWCLMSPPCLESQGCHLIPLCYLLSCSSAWVCYSFCLTFFLPAGIFSWTFSRKNLQYFSLGDRLFCMVPVLQLGEVSWSVVCAACCHMALVFAVMHLCNTNCFIASVHSFFYTFEK